MYARGGISKLLNLELHASLTQALHQMVKNLVADRSASIDPKLLSQCTDTEQLKSAELLDVIEAKFSDELECCFDHRYFIARCARYLHGCTSRDIVLDNS